MAIVSPAWLVSFAGLMSKAEMTHPTPPALADRFDVAIIGGGVVGCATARRFALAGARVVLIEKGAEHPFSGASKANSAILHTGFDAPPGGLGPLCPR